MVRKVYFYTIICFLFLFATSANAVTINEVLNANSQYDNSIVAISVKDLNGNVLYQKNQNKLVHPASTQKIITSAAALNYLGKDYTFETAIYKNAGNVYLKVGADPLFSYQDIVDLVSQYKVKNKNTIKNFIIDDTIIDKVNYGEGWQWDDNASKFFPQISPYIINHNLFEVKATITKHNDVVINYAKDYRETIINKLRVGNANNISIQRNIFDANMPITISGTIKNEQIIQIPAKSPQQMFNNIIAYVFVYSGIPFNTIFKYEKLPSFSAKEASIKHNILDVIQKINTNSDNLAAEVLLKHAGAASVDGTGTAANGLTIVRNYYTAAGIDMTDIILVDGSGASMNDYVTADFMTSALNKIIKSEESEVIQHSMSTPTKGTFNGRLSELNGKLNVKTGTLANTSAVVGYITAATGKKLSFAIMLDNLPKGVNAKVFEDKLIKAIYQSYCNSSAD